MFRCVFGYAPPLISPNHGSAIKLSSKQLSEIDLLPSLSRSEQNFKWRDIEQVAGINSSVSLVSLSPLITNCLDINPSKKYLHSQRNKEKSNTKNIFEPELNLWDKLNLINIDYKKINRVPIWKHGKLFIKSLLFSIISCFTISFYIPLYYVIFYHIILKYIIFIILYYNILYYIILYYIILL